METTDWDRYGTGNYEKCANCMAHCGYEATAVTDAIRHPLKALLDRAPADRDRARRWRPRSRSSTSARPSSCSRTSCSEAVAELPEREVRRRERSDAA